MQDPAVRCMQGLAVPHRQGQGGLCTQGLVGHCMPAQVVQETLDRVGRSMRDQVVHVTQAPAGHAKRRTWRPNNARQFANCSVASPSDLIADCRSNCSWQNEARHTKMEDARTPNWAWAIVLLPLLILFSISVVTCVLGYKHAKSLGESLVSIDATVISVKEHVCGGRSRHLCYQIELLGLRDGIGHKYQTYDAPNGRFSYVKYENGDRSAIAREGVQEILVAPHPGNVEISKMYWSRDEPMEDFKATSGIMFIFIAFQLCIAAVGFWLSNREA
jgi:hypothetical protein